MTARPATIAGGGITPVPPGVTRDRRASASTHSVAACHALERAAACAFADVRKLFHEDGSLKAVDELDAATAAAIEHIGVLEQTSEESDDTVVASKVISYHFGDRAAATDLLMRHLGLYPQERASPRSLRNAAARIVRQVAEGAR